MYRVIAIVWVLILLSSRAGSTTLHVPSSEYPTIQAGVDAAQVGDTVLVADGVYTGEGNRDIEFHGRDIVLRSENGPEATIIDCEGTAEENHRAFRLTRSESRECRIEGFTIRNGYHEVGGGGIYLNRSSSTIDNCQIRDCYGNYGGAVYAGNTESAFIDCQFEGNRSINGGAVLVILATPVFERCLMEGNHAERGGAVYNRYRYTTRMESCNLLFNSADSAGAAIYAWPGSGRTELETCLVAYNRGSPAIEGDTVSVACSNVYGHTFGNWVGPIADQGTLYGNLSAAPIFCDREGGDYRLRDDSPCLPENNSCDQLIGLFGQGCTWSEGESRTWWVNAQGTGDAPTIQAAVDSAGYLDTILLGPGLYLDEGNRDIDFKGKSLALMSTQGSEYTIIDCEGSPEEPHRGIILKSHEDERTVIAGLTIRNGLAPRDSLSERGAVGGGLLMLYSSAQVIDCRFIDNIAMSGAGVYIEGSVESSFRDCSFERNLALLEKHIWDTASTSAVPENHPYKLEMAREILEPPSIQMPLDNSEANRDTIGLVDPRHPGLVDEGERPYYSLGWRESDTCFSGSAPNSNPAGLSVAEPMEVAGGSGVDEPYGGGIYAGSSRITVSNCLFDDDYSWYGGGLCAINTPAIITSCQFDSCSAGLRGGGLFAVGDSLAVADARFFNDSAFLGGGIYADSIVALRIERTDLFANRGAVHGGALALRLCTGEVLDCTVKGNSAYGRGAGLHIFGGRLLVGTCSIMGNSNDLGDGGGCYVSGDSETHFEYCLFCRNTSGEMADGGGGMFISEQQVYLRNCTFADNHFVNLYAYVRPPVIENCIFAFAPGGAGVYFAGSVATLVNCNIYANFGGNWYDAIADQLGHNGNISEHPLFCDRYGENYSLMESSPCLPENNEAGQLIGALGLGCDMRSDIWRVEPDGSGDVPTIQAAIDLATHADTIYLASGTYTGHGNHDLDFHGKLVKLISEEGPEQTIIDCQGDKFHPARAIVFFHGEDSRTEVNGLTLMGGYTYNGAGVFCDRWTAPVFRNCVITENQALSVGGGLVVQASAARFENCIVSRNSSTEGGGAFVTRSNEAQFINCTFVANRAYDGGAMITYWCHPIVDRCIVAYQHQGGSARSLGCWWNPRISCSNIYENFGDVVTNCLDSLQTVDGNFSADPLFCNVATGNYGLLAGSPCAPNNNSCGVLIGARGVGCDPTDVEEPDSTDTDALPTEFELSQNYPNPFNPVTTIGFALPRRAHVEITVYNILGQRVTSLVDEERPAGEYSAVWKGTDSRDRAVSTGVYFYRIKADDFVGTKKMLLLR